MLWMGNDQQHTTPDDVVGLPVLIQGRKGKCIDKTALMILVEWED